MVAAFQMVVAAVVAVEAGLWAGLGCQEPRRKLERRLSLHVALFRQLERPQRELLDRRQPRGPLATRPLPNAHESL